MNTQRWFFVLVAVLGYLYLEKNRVSGTNMLKIFMYSHIDSHLEVGHSLFLKDDPSRLQPPFLGVLGDLGSLAFCVNSPRHHCRIFETINL